MNSEQETFDALRRVPYRQACVEYTMVGLSLGTGMSQEKLEEMIDPALKPLGWSVASLYEYAAEHPDG